MPRHRPLTLARYGIQDDELATYDTKVGDWFSSTAKGGKFDLGERHNLLYASVPQFGKSFALGGNTPMVKGLINFDSAFQNTLHWTY